MQTRNTLTILIKSILNSIPTTPISPDRNDLLPYSQSLPQRRTNRFARSSFQDAPSNRIQLESRESTRAEHPKQMEQGESRHTRRHHRSPQRRQRFPNAMAIGQNHQAPTRRRRHHTDGYRSNGNEHTGSEHQAHGTTTEQIDDR